MKVSYLLCLLRNGNHRCYLVAFVLIFCICLTIRLSASNSQSLWADEVLSLAYSTGHCLEIDPALADKNQGDYIEFKVPVTASYYQAFLRHETPTEGPERIVRASQMGDVHPPLYLLLLYYWTQLFGTSDFSVRSMSILFGMMCLPLIAVLGLLTAGGRTALIACLLFSLSPMAIDYSIEARMYSLFCLFTIALMVSSIQLARHPPNLSTSTTFVLSLSCGMLTHYFFLFVAFACISWLLLESAEVSRRYVILMISVSAFLILPWYSLAPEAHSRYHLVGINWLSVPKPLSELVSSPISNYASYFANLGGTKQILFGVGLFSFTILHSKIRSASAQLSFMLLACAIGGPLVISLVGNNSTSTVARYTIAGMPCSFILLARALSRTSIFHSFILLSILFLLAFPSLLDLYRPNHRFGETYREIGAILEENMKQNDIAVIESIPSGILGVARHLAAERRIYSWVPQLASRQTSDLKTTLGSSSKVYFVRVHTLENISVPQFWLNTNAVLETSFHTAGGPIVLRYSLNRPRSN